MRVRIGICGLVVVLTHGLSSTPVKAQPISRAELDSHLTSVLHDPQVLSRIDPKLKPADVNIPKIANTFYKYFQMYGLNEVARLGPEDIIQQVVLNLIRSKTDIRPLTFTDYVCASVINLLKTTIRRLTSKDRQLREVPATTLEKNTDADFDVLDRQTMVEKGFDETILTFYHKKVQECANRIAKRYGDDDYRKKLFLIAIFYEDRNLKEAVKIASLPNPKASRSYLFRTLMGMNYAQFKDLDPADKIKLLFARAGKNVTELQDMLSIKGGLKLGCL